MRGVGALSRLGEDRLSALIAGKLLVSRGLGECWVGSAGEVYLKERGAGGVNIKEIGREREGTIACLQIQKGF